jgi:hypothetical protein
MSNQAAGRTGTGDSRAQADSREASGGRLRAELPAGKPNAT